MSDDDNLRSCIPPPLQSQYGVDESGRGEDITHESKHGYMMFALMTRFDGYRQYFFYEIPDERITQMAAFLKHTVTADQWELDDRRILVAVRMVYLHRSSLITLAELHHHDHAAAVGFAPLTIQEISTEQLLNSSNVIRCERCRDRKHRTTFCALKTFSKCISRIFFKCGRYTLYGF